MSITHLSISRYWGSINTTVFFQTLILVEYKYDVSKLIPGQNDTILIWY